MASPRRTAGLLVGGAAILLSRTLVMLTGSARAVLKRWVIGLTFMEMVLDVATILSSGRWWLTRSPLHARLPMRLGAVVAVFHAVRVAIFVLGRIGPWPDFDVRPEHRANERDRWTWFQVVFASVLSVAGVVGVVVIWFERRRRRWHHGPGLRGGQ